MSCRAAAERFGVSAASAIRWRQLVIVHGTPAAKPQGGDRRAARIDGHAAFILAAIEAKHDITLVELQALLAERGTPVKLIVEQHVTNAGSDLGFLAETAGAAKDLLGVDRIDVVADMGYYMGEDIAACERAGITPYVARPQRGTAVGDGRFPKERFRYDEAADCYHCPGDQRLDTRSRWFQGGHIIVQYSNPRACGGCELKAQCARGGFRRITRWKGEAVLDRITTRLAVRPDILNIRRETVEHPFGSIKQWMNQGAFLMRGLEKVRAEFSLTALTYNLRRAINLVGVQGLIRAVQA